MDDPVEIAVLEQELGALEARRQLLGDRAGGDPRPGEPDQGVRLGDVDVAEDGERGEHPAGRRVAQEAQERDARGPQPLEGADRLGELHQRERSLLHPRPARGRDDEERDPAARACSAARVTFSPTTAPIEPPMNPKSMTHSAIGWPSIVPVPQTAASRIPVASWAAATRSGYVFWSTNPSGSSDSRPASRSANDAVIEEHLDPRGGRQAEVVAARRADAEDLVELLVEEHLAAGRAFRPEIGRVGVAAWPERRQLDRHVSPAPSATELGRRRRRQRASRGAPARAIGVVARPGRPRRQATNAAPASDRAADVSAPPMSSGRAGVRRAWSASDPTGSPDRPYAEAS